MLGIAQSLRRPAKRHKPDGSSFVWVASPDRENVDERSEWVLRGFIEIRSFANYSQTPPAAFEQRLISKLKLDGSRRSVDKLQVPHSHRRAQLCSSVAAPLRQVPCACASDKASPGMPPAGVHQHSGHDE